MLQAFSRSGRVLLLPVAASLLWLGLTLGLYRQAVRVDEAHRLELEHTRLSTVAQQLMDARNWNAAHGGVYVPQSALGKPNPWLPPRERTLRTVDGRVLVLMNPAYMSRQLAERNTEPGINISIISGRPLRPENRADAWEGEALTQCTDGRREIFSPPSENGQGRLRLLSVLIAQQSCLRCHVDSKVGEVLGGISVSQEAEPYLSNAAQQQRNMRLLYALLGVTGVLGIGGLTLNLVRRRWQAEETSRVKSAFMARLSHDMRTPLTAILGMSELLQRQHTSEKEKKRALRYLIQAGGALLEMVSDVTDHAALEQGGMALHEGPFNPRESLLQCLDIYRPAAEAKGIALSLEVDESVPKVLEGDSFRLRQALGNLVSNAVKFTSRGTVSVQADAKPQSHDRLLLHIRVEDSGPGLSPGESEQIFESFQRGAHAGGKPGTGLGLNIVRTIARRMGGDIRVTSSPGRGCCFCLEVCLRRPPESGLNHEQEPSHIGAAGQGAATAVRSLPESSSACLPGALAGKRILVAEDNKANRYYLERLLRQDGARVRMTEDGADVLAALKDGPWDLVVLDARMPGLDGLDVLERIRHGRAGAPSDQTVVLYTAALSAEDLQRCDHLAPDAMLLKPMSFAELRSRLAQALRSQTGDCHAGHTQGPDPEAPACATEEILSRKRAAAEPVWDREGAVAAMDGDEALLKDLLAVLHEDLRIKQKELTQAAAAKDATSIRRLAHACRNSAGTMRLMRLRTAAAQAEKAKEAQLSASVTCLQTALAEALAALQEAEEQKKGERA